MARWKARGRLPISDNWTFFASSHGWGTMSWYGSKLWCLKGSGSLWAQMSGAGGRPPTTFGVRKLVLGISRDLVCVTLRLAVLIQYRRVTYRHTHRDTQTYDDGYYPRRSSLSKSRPKRASLDPSKNHKGRYWSLVYEAIGSQMTLVINPTVGCHYLPRFRASLLFSGTNDLPKIATGQ